MRASFGNADVVAREIQGQFRPGVDKIVHRKFGDVLKLLWPDKTDEHVAAIAKVDVRTARRWRAGEGDPSWEFMLEVNREMMRWQ